MRKISFDRWCNFLLRILQIFSREFSVRINSIVSTNKGISYCGKVIPVGIILFTKAIATYTNDSQENIVKSRKTMLRVFICGAHSTGKTTLVNEVGKELNIHVEAEVARKVIKDLNLRREDFDPKNNPTKFEELQEKILEAQCAAERRNLKNGTSYIADRGIDPLIYALVYLGEESMQRLLNLPSSKECINR